MIGVLGLARAYQSTIRFYQGREKPAPMKQNLMVTTVRVSGQSFLERQLPGVPEEAAAMSLAFFRSMMRAPEVKMSLASYIIMLAAFGGTFFSRGAKPPEELTQPFLATGAVAFTFFGLAQLMFNQFGFDRNGFRALVLLPVKRKYTLLAKNLSLLPVALGLGLIFVTIVTIVARLPLLVFLGACFQLAAMFLLLSIAGNFISIVAPYRIEAGSLKPTKSSTKTTLLIFVSHLLFPVAMIPVLIPPALGLMSGKWGWCPAAPVNALFSLLLAVFMVLIYRSSLRGLGDLLQRREMDILQIVTREVE